MCVVWAQAQLYSAEKIFGTICAVAKLLIFVNDGLKRKLIVRLLKGGFGPEHQLQEADQVQYHL